MGALLAAFVFGFGYFSNLHYGNEEFARTNQQDAASHRCRAIFWHFMVYIFFMLSALCFLIGLVVAYRGLVCIHDEMPRVRAVHTAIVAARPHGLPGQARQ
jgi:Na+/proline symporter